MEGEASVRAGQESRHGFPDHEGVTLCAQVMWGAAVASLAPVCPVPLLWCRDSYRDTDRYLLREKSISLSDSLTFWEWLLGPARSLGPGVARETSVGTLNVWRTLEGRGVPVLFPVTHGGNAKALRCLQSRLGLGHGCPSKEMSWSLMSWLDRPCRACLLSLSLCSKWCPQMWGTSESS